jgi:hypothetical protein
MVYTIIKKHNIKKNKKYSAYNFRSKDNEEKYEKENILPKSTTSIYNHDCLRFIIGELQKNTK